MEGRNPEKEVKKDGGGAVLEIQRTQKTEEI